MNLARLCAHAHKRFACLLALVLLLPITQSFAAWHVLSHVRAEQAGTDAQAHLAGRNVCDVCLVAVAATGGAPLPKLLDHLQITVPEATPQVQWIHTFCGFMTPAFESRAPPFAPI